MKLTQINPISFSGIKLSSNDAKITKRIVRYITLNGFNCVGKKTYYVNNNIDSKVKIANYIREHYKFYEKEFGILFLPWSQETYFLSERSYEQKMLKWVQEMDHNACINLIL